MAIISKAKLKILLELENGPKHGYELAKRTSLPMGSIYDHLAELVEEGYVIYKEEGRRKIYSLTKRGELLIKVIKSGTR